MKDIKESQQASQGINIGNQGNQAGAMPEGQRGRTTHKKGSKVDMHIPNQEWSSAKNREKNED